MKPLASDAPCLPPSVLVEAPQKEPLASDAPCPHQFLPFFGSLCPCSCCSSFASQIIVTVQSAGGAFLAATVRDMLCLRFLLRQANLNLETEVGRRTEDLLLTNRVCGISLHVPGF